MRARHCLAVLALAALVSCDEPTPSDPLEAVPAALVVTGGDAQTGPVGAPLADPITIRVANAKGRPVVGTAVRFAVVSGGGEVVVEIATSNDQGVARARWTLGTVAADSQVVEVSLASFPAVAAVRLRATARAAEAAALQPVSAGPFAGGVGTALVDSLAVTIRDAFGNPVPGLEVAWEVGADGGAISPARGATNAAGVAKARWTLGLRVDSLQTALARVAGLAPVAFTASATTAGVTLELAKRSGDGQRGPVDRALADSVGVLLRMPDGRPVRGATVTWSVEAGAGSVSPPVSRTDANGAAAAVWRLGTVPGLARVTATVDAGTLIFTSLAEADVAASVARVAGGGVGPVGSALADSLAVRVTDRLGNPVPGAEVAWSASTDGSMHPERSRTGADGVAKARWTLGLVVDSAQQARVVVAGLPAVGFTATATTQGVPLQLARIAGNGQSAEVGTGLADSLEVQLRTPAGAPVRGATVRWSVSPGSGTLSSSPDITDAQGRSRAAWTLGTVAGALQAFAAVDSGTITFAATARAGPAAVVRIGGGDGQAATRNAILADSLVAWVTDRYTNGIPDVLVHWRAVEGEGDGAVEADTVRTDATGRARVRWALGSPLGTHLAEARVDGLAPATFSATSQAGALHLRKVSPTTVLQTRGGTNTYEWFGDTLTVAVSDDQGHAAVGVGVQFRFGYGDVTARTAWDGMARYFYDLAVSRVEPAPPPMAPEAELEGEVVTFPVADVAVRGYIPTVRVPGWPGPFKELDGVVIVVGITETWGRSVPPGMHVSLSDGRGWTASVPDGDTIVYRLGPGTEPRYINVCAPNVLWVPWDAGCFTFEIQVGEPEPASARTPPPQPRRVVRPVPPRRP